MSMRRLIEGSDYCIRYIDMPCSINAFTVHDIDFYNIYVNTSLNYEQCIKATQHELNHIIEDDFFSLLPIDELERLRHSN